MRIGPVLPIGIYEKALPADLSWDGRLSMAAEAGYDFVEMSIDESDSRLSRLSWSEADIASMRTAIAATGVPVFTIGLSAHRKYPLGSAEPALRSKGFDIFRQAIELASELGVKIIQVMGYDVFYEPSTPDSRARFLEGLHQGACWASSAGVMLALENVDVPLVDSVEKAMRFVHIINSPWFSVYPDMGNLVAAGYDPVSQLQLAKNHLVGVHVKDALPGMVRGVPFESGIVPFHDVFKALQQMGFRGPLAVEMWADRDAGGNPFPAAVRARELVSHLIKTAWDPQE
jgi:L-ribulose-5-phosphate 3-epimerase